MLTALHSILHIFTIQLNVISLLCIDFSHQMLDQGHPFRKDSNGSVFARSGEKMKLLGATAAVFKELVTNPKWKDTAIAYVSRTEWAEWAHPLLQVWV